ncbi:Maf family protein [Thermochromatium tepidum]|uniref:dTTP/UTP pyrophosphatase n=1 Tax=Thermochromatium tepidum ATCC 43061 TaxID=316276 RepID=A0A6I6E671_THETI|nr:nucleoside triphosphate pyrophosphatase [Thermochromatium tepidum]QGU33342.1 septum formation inhibitor Maf [Thermochromatium tepidum ATCC 43061]
MTETNHQIYLASRSPRRAELLAQIGVRFAPLAVEIDETPVRGESPEGYVRRIAIEKALVGRSGIPTRDPRPVLAADTAVIVDGEILGKPLDRPDFLRMMARLSGRTHSVLTGVALAWAGEVWYELSVSLVRFRAIDESEQLAYWASGEPRDKAGGYGIQGLGALFVAELRGSYSGVMGLPLYETGCLLQRAGMALLGGERKP